MEKKKNRMIALIFCVMMMMLLAGCGNDGKQAQKEAQRVEPMLSGITMETMTDETFPASFSAVDLTEQNGDLALKVTGYEEELFDAVAITTLKAGDTIVAGGKEYAVENVEQNQNGIISVNGGEEQGGIDFATDDDGGVYYVEGMDDAHTYANLGTASLPLAATFVFIDNSDLDHPDQEYHAEAFRKILEDDANSYGFEVNNTTVTVENRQITEIVRNYQP